MNSLKLARHNQADGLGYCRLCGHEYTDAEVISIDPEIENADIPDLCPNCKIEDDRILYWCNLDPNEPLHSPAECEKYHNEP